MTGTKSVNRRSFLMSFPAIACALPAHAYSSMPYSPKTWPDIRETKERIVLNFRASWSLTCQMKHDILTDLLASEQKYAALNFVDVDWDTFGQSQWTESLKVERRSTLVAFKDDQEIARVVNQPFEHKIVTFLDAVIAA